MSQADFGTYVECSLALAVDLINAYHIGTGEFDHLPDVAALQAFIKDHFPSETRRPTKRDLEEVWALGRRLRAVFEAGDEHQASRILNEILAESGARPELTDHDDGEWHLHFAPRGASLAQRFAAESAMALSVVIAEGGYERLRVCDSETCFDVFVDQSRNQSRRYCSPRVCGNRASVAAFRARQRAAAQS